MNYVFPYCRASTDDQVGSPHQQSDRIVSWFKSQALDGYKLHDPLIDPATSSRVPLSERPYGQILLSRVQSGDIVVVAKLDRAFRNAREAYNVAHDLKERGVRFVCLDMNIDTSSPIGKMMFAVLAGMAEMERDMISSRTKDGLQWRKDRGFANSRPPWGWAIQRKKVSGMEVGIYVPSLRERFISFFAEFLVDEYKLGWSAIRDVLLVLDVKGRKSYLHPGGVQDAYGHAKTSFQNDRIKDSFPEVDDELRGQVHQHFGHWSRVDFLHLIRHRLFPGQASPADARKLQRLFPAALKAS